MVGVSSDIAHRQKASKAVTVWARKKVRYMRCEYHMSYDSGYRVTDRERKPKRRAFSHHGSHRAHTEEATRVRPKARTHTTSTTHATQSSETHSDSHLSLPHFEATPPCRARSGRGMPRAQLRQPPAPRSTHSSRVGKVFTAPRTPGGRHRARCRSGDAFVPRRLRLPPRPQRPAATPPSAAHT